MSKDTSELSMGWVGLGWAGFGSVGSKFSAVWWLGSWVSVGRLQKIERFIYYILRES